MLEVIGALALTAGALYLILGLGSMAFLSVGMGGPSRDNIFAAFICSLIMIGTAVLWWFLVGVRISIGLV